MQFVDNPACQNLCHSLCSFFEYYLSVTFDKVLPFLNILQSDLFQQLKLRAKETKLHLDFQYPINNLLKFTVKSFAVACNHVDCLFCLM